MLISRIKYIDVSRENKVFVYLDIHPTKVGWIFFLTSHSFFDEVVQYVINDGRTVNCFSMIWVLTCKNYWILGKIKII